MKDVKTCSTRYIRRSSGVKVTLDDTTGLVVALSSLRIHESKGF